MKGSVQKAANSPFGQLPEKPWNKLSKSMSFVTGLFGLYCL